MKKASKKVVIGLSGRTDSLVSAYILKKQGYDCIGVTLDFEDRSFHQAAYESLELSMQRNPDKDFIVQTGVDPENFLKKPLIGRCFVNDFKKIKNFCEWLDIPFYASHAQQDFYDEVLEGATASLYDGRAYNPCIDCQALKLDILFKKAKLLNADFVATGHYAKVYYNKSSQEYSLLSSNDLEHDQSALLSALTQAHLESLILPLSEMRKSEVQKLAKIIEEQVHVEKSKDDIRPCFTSEPRFSFYAEAMVANSLISDGEFIDYEDEDRLGDHYGIHYFRVGQSRLKLSSDKSLDSTLFIYKINRDSGQISTCHSRDLKYKYIFVSGFNIGPNFDSSKPLDLFIRAGVRGQLSPCRVYFRNNQSALIELDQESSFFYALGESVTFYTRPGVAGRLVAHAKVESYGLFYEGELTPFKVKSESSTGDEIQDARHNLNINLKY